MGKTLYLSLQLELSEGHRGLVRTTVSSPAEGRLDVSQLSVASSLSTKARCREDSQAPHRALHHHANGYLELQVPSHVYKATYMKPLLLLITSPV